MSAHRKQRPDAKLKTLSEERQAQIAELLKTKSLAEVKSYLAAEFGLSTSQTALSQFWSWYQLQRKFEANETTINAILERMKQQNPSVSEEVLFNVGQQIFSTLAIQQEDPLAWSRIQRNRQREEALRLESRRIAILEQKASQADEAKQVTESELTAEEKERKMRLIFGLS